MIDIQDKKMCCGCSACVDVCPARCISWRGDGEGFPYPVVDLERCMHCDVCEDVCPMLTPLPKAEPVRIVAAQNPDESVRRMSSSGGLFSMLARRCLAQGGIVYGAVFDDEWLVHHAGCEDERQASRIRGSKYMQSRLEGCLREIKEALRSGRRVLFSGTSCQTAGARRMLGSDPKLLLVDVACHSVPSPEVWRQYLREIVSGIGLHEKVSGGGLDIKNITKISFRDKSRGWKDFSLMLNAGDKTILSEPSRKNAYMRGFIKGLYSRPACAVCPAKAFASGADITIADFWGEDEFFPESDGLGTTLAFALTASGAEVVAGLDIPVREVALEQAVKHNPRIMSPAAPHAKREEFFAGLGTVPIDEMVRKFTKRALKERIIKRIRR